MAADTQGGRNNLLSHLASISTGGVDFHTQRKRLREAQSQYANIKAQHFHGSWILTASPIPRLSLKAFEKQSVYKTKRPNTYYKHKDSNKIIHWKNKRGKCPKHIEIRKQIYPVF